VNDRNERGQFVKGNKAGKGRPPKPEIEELRKAIKAVEKRKGKKLLEHFVERAYKNDSALVALVKKLVPDKTQADLDLRGDLSVTVISAVPRPKDAN